MNVTELGQKMIEMVNAGPEKEAEFVDAYYAADIVSIEGAGDESMPQQMQGIDAIKGKHDWWYSNNEVHSSTAYGPYVGHREDQFVVRFTLDMTPNGGERSQMDEVGVFTVKGGKIIQEEFLYLMG